MLHVGDEAPDFEVTDHADATLRFTIFAAARSCSGSIQRPTHLAERPKVPGSGTSPRSTKRRTPPSSA